MQRSGLMAFAPWRQSVRVRLALWHAGTLAVVLSLFALGTCAHLRQTAAQRIDRSLGETTQAFVEVWRGEMDEEGESPTPAAAEAVREFRYRDRAVLVFDATARLIASSDSEVPLASREFAARQAATWEHLLRIIRHATTDVPAWATIGDGEDAVRVHASRVALSDSAFIVVPVRALASEAEALDAFLEAMLIAIPIALLLSGLGGYLLARASLAPVTAMAEQAERISATMPDARLPIANPRDELGELGGVLNRLLDRLVLVLDQQRQFMADASHELRTPVAALRSAADVTLDRSDRSAAEYVEALRVVSAEGRRLSRIVEDLFLLARADAGQQPVRSDDFYLDEVLTECARAARALATARRVEIGATIEEEAPFRGDEALVRRLVMNLVDNGIKHTPLGGRVSLALDRAEGRYRITVRDTGGGVPEEARTRIFERFFRADVARSRGAETGGDGAGLGLSIARWIAEAHGGDVTLESTGTAGSTFVVTLPVPRAAAGLA